MSESIDRREFIGSAAAGVAMATLARSAEQAANDKIVLGVMGMGGRGTTLARDFESKPGAQVAYVCDVDERRANQAAEAVSKVAGNRPKAVVDFRRILDDRSVDALVVATCNHWHAPAAILGCTAGKHVYVEKPCSHNAREGELMVAAARKYDRRVQMGTQRRSRPSMIEGITRVREGAIGKAYFAQCWYSNTRPSIGRGKEAAVPDGLDFELWQGPAPRRPYRDNILHYNWHWFWHWGNGELGNNGVHCIDLCRWGLGVDYPIRVTSSGGRFRYDDDQETPDTHVVGFEFEGGKSITWTGLSCSRHGPDNQGTEACFHGEKGSLVVHAGGYTVYDPAGKEAEVVKGNERGGGQHEHLENFLAAIRGTAKLNQEIEEGHKSTLLCHLGNIAHRTGRTLRCEPSAGRILGDAEAMNLWGREYHSGWEPKV